MARTLDSMRSRWLTVPRPGSARTTLLPDADASRSAAPLASVIAALVVAAAVAVSLQGKPVVKAGEARLVLNGARVSVARSGGAFAPARGTLTLHAGDRARVTSGEPELQLVRNARAVLRKGTVVEVGAASGPAVHVERGDVLAFGPVSISANEATVTVRGVAKLIEHDGLLAGAYNGVARVDAAGAAPVTLPQFRQLAVLGLGAAPGAIDPLHLDNGDTWDRRLLGEVMILDDRLETSARGLDAQLGPGSGQTPGFYRQLIPALEHEDLSPGLISGRSPGENLIGLTLASLDRGPFTERTGHIFEFRDEGARWGLVAADRGLNPGKVLDEFQLAIGRLPSPQLAALPPLPKRPRTTPATLPPATTTTTRPGGGPPPPTTTTTLPRVPTGVPPVDSTTDAVERILENLLAPILGPGK